MPSRPRRPHAHRPCWRRLNINRRATVVAIRAVTDLPGMRCFYAGNAFSSPAARAGVRGVHLGDDLLGAAEIVERTLVLAPAREEVPSRLDRRP